MGTYDNIVHHIKLNFITKTNNKNNKLTNEQHKRWKRSDKNPRNNKNKVHKSEAKIKQDNWAESLMLEPLPLADEDEISSCARTLCDINATESFKTVFDDQMGEESKTVTQEASFETEQNVQFQDEDGQWIYDTSSTIDETRGYAFTDDVPIGDFFGRPVKIFEFDWGPGVNVFHEFNPWNLFFRDKRVANRITNYNLLKCTLKVKFVVNGNSFFYGKLIASYLPKPTDDELVTRRSLVSQDLISASQRPHIFIDPTTSSGGVITCPFFNEFDAVSIPDATFAILGDINVMTMSQLKHANGAIEVVRVSVFAWAEDFEMAIPTSLNLAGLTPQMGKETQTKRKGKAPRKSNSNINRPKKSANKNVNKGSSEYESKGPVSTVASYVSDVANALTAVPFMAPYAMATSTIAQGIGSMASIFGFSRPNNIENINVYKPVAMGNMSSGNMHDTCERIVLDAKQELTVDPRTAGLGGADEMSLAAIASRESYYVQFPWAVGTDAETLLWNTYVTPCINDTHINAGAQEYHLPACAYAAVPFKYWRGTMRFRFQIVCSGFHKGRLKFVWDPNYSVSDEYNVNYIEIHDIGESRDFTMDIGWGQPQAYLETTGLNLIGATQSTSPLGFSSYPTNGTLSVYVMNDLTVPNSTVNNDISINVFVSAGEDIEFQSPHDGHMRLMSLRPVPQLGIEDQSGIENEVSEPQAEPDNAPVIDNEDVCLGGGKNDGDVSVYFGEKIVSLRSCLKRYTFSHTWGYDDALAVRVKATQWMIPMTRGYNNGVAFEQDSASNGYIFSSYNLVNHVLSAFAGWRGSIRWKAALIGSPESRQGIIAISRNAGNNPVTTGVTRSLMYGASQSKMADSAVDFYDNSRFGGLAANTQTLTGSVEAEIPYLMNRRFSPARLLTREIYDSRVPYMDFIWSTDGTTSANQAMVLETFCAIGEDFNVFFFLGAPIYYLVPDPDAI